MNGNSILKDKLFCLFSELNDYVILRNHDIMHALECGSDIDILVNNLEEAQNLLLKHFGPPLYFAKRSYVLNHFYEWGQIDLMDSLQWRGAKFLSTDYVLSKTDYSEFNFKKPRIAHEATISWLTSILWGGFFKLKYKEIINRAGKNNISEFSKTLKISVGEEVGTLLTGFIQNQHPEKSEQCVSEIRSAVRRQALNRNRIKSIKEWLNFWFHEVKLRFNPPLPWIAVLGADGSGKSTILEAIKNEFEKSSFNIKIFHWRPNYLSGNPNDIKQITNPHSKPPRGYFLSIIKIVFLLADWTLGYWLNIVNLRVRKKLVVFDRYFLDLLIDQKRYRYGANVFWVKLIYKLIPKPNQIFLFDAPAEVLQSRKQEVSFVETKRQRDAYRNLIEKQPNGIIIDANQPIEQVTDIFKNKLLELIEKYTLEKNHKFIKYSDSI